MQRDRPSLRVSASEDDDPIVIIGAGLSGTALAVGLAQKGYDVVVITKYDSPGARTQQIKLDRSPIKFLKSFYDSSDTKDRKLIDNLEKNSTESIGHIEKFLHRKIQNKSSVTLITEKEAKLVGVDMRLERVTIEDKDKQARAISFRHIIDASGTERAAYMLAHGVKPDDKKSRKKWEATVAYQPKHTAQGTASLHLSPGVEYKPKFLKRMMQKIIPGTIHKVRISKKELELLHDQFKWEKPSAPEVYVISNNERTKFYVGGDVPEHFLKMDARAKKEAIESWAKTMLSLSLGIDENNLYVKDKQENTSPNVKGEIEKEKEYSHKENDADRKAEAKLKKFNLRRTVFPLQLLRATEHVLSSGKKDKHLFLIGDAIQSAYFLQAHGSNDALAAVEEFLKCLPDKGSTQEFDMNRWLIFVNKLIHDHDVRMRKVGIEVGIARHERSADQLGFFKSDARESSWTRSSPPSQRRSSSALMGRAATLNDLQITSEADDKIKKPSVSDPSLPVEKKWKPGKL